MVSRRNRFVFCLVINFSFSGCNPNTLDRATVDGSSKSISLSHGSHMFVPVETFGGEKDIPKTVLFSSCACEVLLRAFFPTAILPMGDRFRFAPVFNRVPACRSSTWWYCYPHVVARSVSGNRNNLGASDMCTCVQAVTASLASPAIQEVWKLYQRMVLLPFAQLGLPCSASSSLYPLSSLTLSFSGARLSPCMFGDVWQAWSVGDCRGP